LIWPLSNRSACGKNVENELGSATAQSIAAICIACKVFLKDEWLITFTRWNFG
jgi:hypothetical protein